MTRTSHPERVAGLFGFLLDNHSTALVAADGTPGWLAPISGLIGILAVIFGIYKGFIETRKLKVDAATAASSGAMSGMGELNTRLEVENIRLNQRVEDLEKAFRLVTERMYALEAEVHRFGGTIPPWVQVKI